jgi:hypothetical protein
MRRTTVIYTHGGGRLGNQLIRFGHWMAWACEQGDDVEVLDFAFWPYATLFAQWSEYPACLFPPRPSPLARIARLVEGLPRTIRRRLQGGRRIAHTVHRLGTVWPGWQAIELDDQAGESIDLDDPGFLARIKEHGVTTCAGWKISAWRLFEAHESQLRKYFRPAEPWMRRGEQFMREIRAHHDYVIGLLIRQTDYRVWHEGRFSYSTKQYAAWARQLLDLRPQANPAIVIACDEYQDPNAFAGLPCYFSTGAVNGGGHWFESFVALSLCDLVVSPPSTFSAAAAFVTGIPLLPLIQQNQQLSADQLLSRAMSEAARHPVFSLAVK